MKSYTNPTQELSWPQDYVQLYQAKKLPLTACTLQSSPCIPKNVYPKELH